MRIFGCLEAGDRGRGALGDRQGADALPVKVTLTVGRIDLKVEIEGTVELE